MIWQPEGGKSFMASADEVVRSYTLFLEVRYPKHHKLFLNRLTSDPDAARAEAVVFSWLRLMRFAPSLAEDPSTGGPDFLSEPEGYDPFLLEVASLNAEAISKKAAWPNELDGVARTFSMVTPSLFWKAQKKAAQFAGNDMAHVLAICLTHVAASALLGTLAAEWLMSSESKLQVPVALDGVSKDTSEVTDLKHAAFFKIEHGAVVPVRRSISAILLIAIWHDQLDVVGLLHPEPSRPFDYRCFGDVPFLRVEWPVRVGAIRTEWVVGYPDPSKSPYATVTLTDAELRGE